MAEYIDKDVFLQHLQKDPLYPLVEQYGITGVIESFPTADVQPVKHGRWIPRVLPLNKAGNECSACLAISVGAMKPYYCPNCGADMRGE